MALLDYQAALRVLENSFDRAQAAFFAGAQPRLAEEIEQNLEIVFSSNTQAYREVLLGCCIAKILNAAIDIHLPYVKQGEAAFNGRELDEKVINPFLQSKQIPSSKGPYLSVFRRQVKFLPETREGLRDQGSYDALLALINFLAETADPRLLEGFLTSALFKFIRLREDANIPIKKIHRISLIQYKGLLNRLINVQSGGRLPVIFVISMFETLKEFFGLDWQIKWQSINEADAASGAGGDITILSGNSVLLSIEITLRQVDKARLVSTFNTKIATSGIEDYLFLVGANSPPQEAIEQAERYFAQGHEINFAEIVNWIVMLLATLGKRGRELYGANLVSMLESLETPQAIKVSWNEAINDLFAT